VLLAASVQLGLRGLCDLLCQLIQQCVHSGVAALGVFYLAAGVHNGRMVPSTQMTANLLKAVFGQISANRQGERQNGWLPLR